MLLFKRREPIDLTKVGQLPTYKYLCERHFTCSVEDSLKRLKGTKNNRLNDIMSEFRNAWIYFNVPPQTTPGVKRKFDRLLEKFDKLRFTTETKRKFSWNTSVQDILEGLDSLRSSLIWKILAISQEWQERSILWVKLQTKFTEPSQIN